MNRRQKKLYEHDFAIYRLSNSTIDSVGTPNTGLISRVQAVGQTITGYFGHTSNANQDSNIGRFKIDNFETMDSLHTDADIDLRDTDFVRNETSGSLNFGTVYRVQGSPRIIINSKRRKPNKLSVLLVQVENIPLGIP